MGAWRPGSTTCSQLSNMMSRRAQRLERQWTIASVIVLLAPFADVEYRRDRVRRSKMVGERGFSDNGTKSDEPDAVLVPVEQIGAHLQREARLADAARAPRRDEPVGLGEQLRDGEDVDVAADEARDLKRQVVRQRFERAQRREIRRRESGR